MGLPAMRPHELIPQTVLALRGSYGVGKERGYDSFVDPVAARRRQLLCTGAVNGEGHPQIL